MDRSRAGEPPPAAARSGVPTGLVVASLCVVLLISIVLAIGLGPATIAPAETLRYLIAAITGGTIEAGEVSAYQIIWQIRTPRVLLAALVGAGLGAVGVAIQTLVRNPLADPYVLGVSSGASAGAVAVGTLGLLGGLGLYALSVGAFAGAGIASVLVFLAARTRLGLQPLRLVLTGVDPVLRVPGGDERDHLSGAQQRVDRAPSSTGRWAASAPPTGARCRSSR